MKRTVLKIGFVLFPLFIRAAETGNKIEMFGQPLFLPESCVLYSKPSVKSKENIKYVCDDTSEYFTIYLTSFVRSNIEGVRNGEITQSFAELNVGKIIHYKANVKSLESGEESFIHMLCDNHLCIEVFERSEKYVSQIKAQLKR